MVKPTPVSATQPGADWLTSLMNQWGENPALPKSLQRRAVCSIWAGEPSLCSYTSSELEELLSLPAQGGLHEDTLFFKTIPTAFCAKPHTHKPFLTDCRPSPTAFLTALLLENSSQKEAGPHQTSTHSKDKCRQFILSCGAAKQCWGKPKLYLYFKMFLLQTTCQITQTQPSFDIILSWLTNFLRRACIILWMSCSKNLDLTSRAIHSALT